MLNQHPESQWLEKQINPWFLVEVRKLVWNGTADIPGPLISKTKLTLEEMFNLWIISQDWLLKQPHGLIIDEPHPMGCWLKVRSFPGWLTTVPKADDAK